jgi:hypothetical protein
VVTVDIERVTTYRLYLDPGEVDAVTAALWWARRAPGPGQRPWPWADAIIGRITRAEPLAAADADGLQREIIRYCRAKYGPGEPWPSVLDTIAAKLQAVIP